MRLGFLFIGSRSGKYLHGRIILLISFLLPVLVCLGCGSVTSQSQEKSRHRFGSARDALFRACAEGDLVAAQALLDAGTDVNVKRRRAKRP
jgi:hypothetical protein